MFWSIHECCVRKYIDGLFDLIGFVYLLKNDTYILALYFYWILYYAIPTQKYIYLYYDNEVVYQSNDFILN